ncbi:MAG: type II toxin-antitoxin system HicA family toxin [Candidatus Nitrosotenuis sp.]
MKLGSKLPVLSWRDILKILRKAGFSQVGQTGSHIYMTDGAHKVTIPRHSEIAKGTLLSIIAQSGLPRKYFLK